MEQDNEQQNTCTFLNEKLDANGHGAKIKQPSIRLGRPKLDRLASYNNFVSLIALRTSISVGKLQVIRQTAYSGITRFKFCSGYFR